MNTLLHFIKDESGNGPLQYCFMGCIITACIAGPLKLIGIRLAIIFMTIANALALH